MASSYSRKAKRRRKRVGNYFELLPEEISVEILSKLPLSNVFQAQSVCHSWRNIVRSSPLFHKLWDEKNREQWLVMDHCDGEVDIFNTSGKFKKKMFDSSSWLLKAASGGLLLYLNKIDGMFQVVNPLTMEARNLPDPIIGKEHLSFCLMLKPAAIDLVVDSTTKTYQVIVFGSLSPIADLLIYRSATFSWEIKVVEKISRFTDWAPYRTESNQTVHCFPLEGHALASYNLCGEIVHAMEKYGGDLKGFVIGKSIKVAIWGPPIGRDSMFIFELDEASSQWQVVSVCRWNKGVQRRCDRVTFGELLCEKDFVLSCLGVSKDCVWIIPAFSGKDVYQTKLILQQQKDIFNAHEQDKSSAFPTPLRFSICP